VSKIRLITVVALSTGWLLPFYLAFDAFRSFLVTELEPMINGQPLTHSLGMLYLCGIWLEIAAGWLAIAIAFWVVFMIRLTDKRVRKGGEPIIGS
jgi:hypothetical protein